MLAALLRERRRLGDEPLEYGLRPRELALVLARALRPIERRRQATLLLLHLPLRAIELRATRIELPQDGRQRAQVARRAGVRLRELRRRRLDPL